MTVNESTKKKLFSELDKAATEVLSAASAYNNRLSQERATIAELETEIPALEAKFREASRSDADNETLCIELRQEKFKKETLLDIHRAKLEALQEEEAKQSLFRTREEKTAKAREQVHALALDQIAEIVPQLLSVFDEYAAAERSAIDKVNTAQGLYELGIYMDGINIADNVDRTQAGSALYKALNNWMSAYNSDGRDRL